MAEAWARRKREANAANTQHQIFQEMYRTDALRVRAHADKLTEKNRKEVLALGIQLE